MIHSVLLTSNNFAAIVYIQPYEWIPILASKTNIVIPITDTIVLLFICYICVTLDEPEDLNRFDCYLIENGNGGYELRFVLKDDVPEANGVPHKADVISE